MWGVAWFGGGVIVGGWLFVDEGVVCGEFFELLT